MAAIIKTFVCQCSVFATQQLLINIDDDEGQKTEKENDTSEQAWKRYSIIIHILRILEVGEEDKDAKTFQQQKCYSSLS